MPQLFVTSGQILIENDFSIVPIRGEFGPIFITDLLANATGDATLQITFQRGTGSCVPAGQDAISLLLNPGEQLAINLLSPMLIIDGSQLCLQADGGADTGVSFSLFGYQFPSEQ